MNNGASGLTVQPMVHVADMGDALRFYEGLGATRLFGSADGDWALLDFNGTRLALLAHPPGDGKRETVELQFACAESLEAVEARMREIDPAFIEREAGDEAFGRMLKLQTPDGLLVKIVEIARDAVE